MNNISYYLKLSYSGLLITMIIFLILMFNSNYKFNVTSAPKDSYVITPIDIIENLNLQKLDAKTGDYVLDNKLIRFSEHFNTKDILLGFAIVVATFLLSMGEMNFIKIALGFFGHIFLIFIPESIQSDLSLTDIFVSIPYYLIFALVAMAIINYIFYLLFPYIAKTYSNSLVGLYINTKKATLRKKLEEERKNNE